MYQNESSSTDINKCLVNILNSNPSEYLYSDWHFYLFHWWRLSIKLWGRDWQLCLAAVNHTAAEIHRRRKWNESDQQTAAHTEAAELHYHSRLCLRTVLLLEPCGKHRMIHAVCASVPLLQGTPTITRQRRDQRTCQRWAAPVWESTLSWRWSLRSPMNSR